MSVIKAIKIGIRKLIKRGSLSWFRLKNSRKEKFTCPICDYYGPFQDKGLGFRKHARCPNCGALERHRLQFLVLQTVLKKDDLAKLKMLHFAPEVFFREYFMQRVKQYETADLEMDTVDWNVDIQALPFLDDSYDLVYASHVLEHVYDDKEAIREICRVLKPGGMAILPIPMVGERTIEYAEPDRDDWDHVRAPGLDYFERFEACFSKVTKYDSTQFPGKHQLFIYEAINEQSIQKVSLGLSADDGGNIDFVPVCYV